MLIFKKIISLGLSLFLLMNLVSCASSSKYRKIAHETLDLTQYDWKCPFTQGNSLDYYLTLDPNGNLNNSYFIKSSYMKDEIVKILSFDQVRCGRGCWSFNIPTFDDASPEIDNVNFKIDLNDKEKAVMGIRGTSPEGDGGLHTQRRCYKQK